MLPREIYACILSLTDYETACRSREVCKLFSTIFIEPGVNYSINDVPMLDIPIILRIATGLSTLLLLGKDSKGFYLFEVTNFGKKFTLKTQHTFKSPNELSQLVGHSGIDRFLVRYMRNVIGYLPEQYPVKLLGMSVNRVMKYIPTLNSLVTNLSPGTHVASNSYMGPALLTIIDKGLISLSYSTFPRDQIKLIESFFLHYNVYPASVVQTKYVADGQLLPGRNNIHESKDHVENYVRIALPHGGLYIHYDDFDPTKFSQNVLLNSQGELELYSKARGKNLDL